MKITLNHLVNTDGGKVTLNVTIDPAKNKFGNPLQLGDTLMFRENPIFEITNINGMNYTFEHVGNLAKNGEATKEKI